MRTTGTDHSTMPKSEASDRFRSVVMNLTFHAYPLAPTDAWVFATLAGQAEIVCGVDAEVVKSVLSVDPDLTGLLAHFLKLDNPSTQAAALRRYLREASEEEIAASVYNVKHRYVAVIDAPGYRPMTTTGHRANHIAMNALVMLGYTPSHRVRINDLRFWYFDSGSDKPSARDTTDSRAAADLWYAAHEFEGSLEPDWRRIGLELEEGRRTLDLDLAAEFLR